LPADAPWEKAQNVAVRAKPAAPLDALDKRQRNLLIGLGALVLLVAFVAGINHVFFSDDEETQQSAPVDDEVVRAERAEAESVINAAIAEIRSQYEKHVPPHAIVQQMGQRFARGEYETPHYRVSQATLTRRTGPGVPEVVVVCVPKVTATDQRASGYAEFRWASDQPVKLEWK
jgi:hypothetical protein